MKKKEVLHQVIVNYLAGQRRGSASTKTRAEVRGGGKKPWRQKGTGRARAGSIRSPLWVGGGRAFGPRPRDYSYPLPKKIKRLALRQALSLKAREKNLLILEDQELKAEKTRELARMLKNLQIDKKKVLLIMDNNKEKNKGLLQAARNIGLLNVTSAATLNTYDLLNNEKIIFSKESLNSLQQRISKHI